MRFVYGRQDMPDVRRAQENCFLMGNGLGGYASLSAAFSMTRCDHGLLVAARVAPNDRISLVGRLQETLNAGGTETFLSTQEFADGTCEDGWKHLSSLVVEDTVRWVYWNLDINNITAPGSYLMRIRATSEKADGTLRVNDELTSFMFNVQ